MYVKVVLILNVRRIVASASIFSSSNVLKLTNKLIIVRSMLTPLTQLVLVILQAVLKQV